MEDACLNWKRLDVKATVNGEYSVVKFQALCQMLYRNYITQFSKQHNSNAQ